MKLQASEKTLKQALFLFLVLLGIQTFFFAVYGFNNTPYYDVGFQERTNSTNWRCPDWKFHNCCATTLNVSACGSLYNPSHYVDYPLLVHGFAFYSALVTGFPALFWLAFVLAACVALFAVLLFHFANGALGGVAAIVSFFFLIPLGALLVLGSPLFSWIDLTECGLITFIVACALFVFLLLNVENVGLPAAVVLSVLLVLVHNYGVVLALFAIACIALEKATQSLTRVRVPRTWFALAGVWVWLVLLSMHFYTYSGERVILLLYFLVSLEFGRFLNQQLR